MATPLQPDVPVAPALAGRTSYSARAGRRPRFYRYQPVPPVGYDDDGYPCEDSAVQNFLHNGLSIYLIGALSARFAGRAMVWGDAPLLYRQGDRRAVMAPDVLVAFNTQPRLSRDNARSYKLWQRPLPEFVLEVLSPSTSRNDLTDKKYTFATLGVREYWLVDPGGQLMDEELVGHRLRGRSYQRMPRDGKGRLASSVLGLELRIVEDAELTLIDDDENATLRFFDLESGEVLRSHSESEAARLEAESARLEAESARLEAESARSEADAARLEAEAALEKAEQRIAELQAAMNSPSAPMPDAKND